MPPPAQPHGASAWRYVDRARAHEVHVVWDPTGRRVRIVELAPGAPAARFEDEQRVEQAWELEVALWLLEARLSQIGEYWRAQSGREGWWKVQQPAGLPPPETRRNEVLKVDGAQLLHHFHDPRAKRDRVLVGLRVDAAGFRLLRAHVDIPALEVERVDVLHERLPLPLARSLLLREQSSMRQAELRELFTREDYTAAFGAGGDKRAARVVDEAVARALGRASAAPAPAQAQQQVVEQFLGLLDDPRLGALHRRFLRLDEEEDLLATGPIDIRRAMRQKRAGVAHDEQHLLTILEASLLARHRVRSGAVQHTDPEVVALTRLAYYL
ncbi:MAG TPA: hypothetical protein VM582_09550 [Candidatus Thermoplasmatota archaeon]|nr:hypothetical protein [Candidatus Thermoplasmatota archaeon]